MTDSENNLIEQCYAYFDGAMTPDEVETFLSQLKNNPEARQLFDQLTQLHQELKNQALVEPPAGLEDRILGALEQEHAVLSLETIRRRRMLPLKAVAALLLGFGVGAVFYFNLLTPQGDSPQVANHASGKPPVIAEVPRPTKVSLPRKPQLTPAQLAMQPTPSPFRIRPTQGVFPSLTPIQSLIPSPTLANIASAEDTQWDDSFETLYYGVEDLNAQVAFYDEALAGEFPNIN